MTTDNPASSSRRNVVVILCDQLRPDFLSIYGCEAVPTPSLDRLAALGVVFDRAITVSTVCAPARASMMTGRYVSDHGVWTNDIPFRDGMEFLAERMNELGYATGAFGKLHHYPADDAKGFRLARQMEEGRLGEREPYLAWLRERHPDVTRMFNARDGQFEFPESEYYEHWIASEALTFIEDAVQEAPAQPFLAWVSFQGPHAPLDPPAAAKGTVDGTRLPAPLRRSQDVERSAPPTVRSRTIRSNMPEAEVLERMRVVYAEQMVTIDRQIGRIIDRLEQLGLLEQTTLIFSADHGDMLGDYRLGAKGPFPYRAQLNIPLVLANHPHVPTGARSNALTGNLDIPGTVLDIAGADRPLGYSRSLVDLAQAAPAHPRTVNFSEFCDSVKTVENARYRLAYYPFSGHAELYDIIGDPDETTNLAGRAEFAGVRAELLGHIIDFMLVAKGIRVEAQDLVGEKQVGAAAKHPDYQRDFTVCFPLSRRERELLDAAGFPSDYNEFCRDKPVTRSYSKPYWETESR